MIRSRDRCGECAACLNRHWKKACFTRRQEMEAEAADAAGSAGSAPGQRQGPAAAEQLAEALG